MPTTEQEMQQAIWIERIAATWWSKDAQYIHAATCTNNECEVCADMDTGDGEGI